MKIELGWESRVNRVSSSSLDRQLKTKGSQTNSKRK